MKRILMTGATGYLGSRVLERLLGDERGYELTVLKRSASNLSRIQHLMPKVQTVDLEATSLRDLFARERYDAVFHFATNYGRGQIPSSEVVEANLLLPLRLLETGREHGLEVFLNTDTMLDKAMSDYSLSKRQFHEWLQVHSSRLLAVNVALEHFYGPGDDRTKFVTHVLDRLLGNEPRLALSPGTQQRDFIYVDDVVEAFRSIIGHTSQQRAGYLRYEVGSGTSVTIREFVEQAKRLAGNSTTSLDFGAVPFRKNEPMDVKVDLTALEATGWKPRWSLTDGLTETIHQERARR